jgi:hypothetical protein
MPRPGRSFHLLNHPHRGRHECQPSGWTTTDATAPHEGFVLARACRCAVQACLTPRYPKGCINPFDGQARILQL